MDPTDQLFGGRYRIVGEVGRGGMGVIYRGVDTILDREVAIKVMSTDFADSGDDAKARFLREAKAAAKLQHRNIVTVFEFAEQDGVSYIVMEFLKGKSLAARLAAESPMLLDQKLDVMTELCNGLQFAHENGVIHRDVKPANVWILDDGAVKLVDFGIAKVSSSTATMRGDVMGSASYMSPEQIEGHAVTGRSDVFSAAVVLYEMLARKRPFEGDSPTATMMQIVQVEPPPLDSLVPGLPKALLDAIRRGLAKNPDERFQSAAEFGAELQLIRMGLPRSEETVFQAPPADATIHLNTLPFKAEPLPSKDPTGAERSGPSMWTYGATGAAVLVIVVGFALWLNRDAATPGPGTRPSSATPTPTPPDPPPMVDFRVESRPSGAQVLINGSAVGQTPTTVKLAAAGAAFQLRLRDYEPQDVKLDATMVGHASGLFEMTRATSVAPQMVQVVVSGSYPFEVRENDRPIGAAAEEHRFTRPATTRLTLYSSEYFLNEPLIVRADRNGAMERTIPGPGFVFFSGGSESCQIFLGQKALNTVVGQKSEPIAAGAHQFRFVCRDGTRPTPRNFTVVAGETQTLVIR